MQWWEALDPDVQKYAAGGIITGLLALVGTIVTFILSGIRDGRRETARRKADREAEDARRQADREAEDRRRQAELDDRRDARAHAEAEQVRALSREALRESLSIAIGLLATWDGSRGGRVWTEDPTTTARVQALQASALTVHDAGVREGVRYGASSLLGVETRVDAGMLADDEIRGEERRILKAISELLAAALRGDVKQLEMEMSFLTDRARRTDEASEVVYREPASENDHFFRSQS